MCGRICQTLGTDQLIRLAGTTLVRNSDRYNASCNVCPTNYIPTIRHHATSTDVGNQRCLDMMKWGHEAPFGMLIINARCEELQEKRTFIPLINSRRGVVIVEGYYEWTPKKEPWIFRPKTFEEKHSTLDKVPCLYIAALYSKSDEVILLTRSSMEGTSHVHDRMPVLLGEDQIDMWIDTDNNKFEKIVNNYILNDNAEKWKSLTCYRVGPYVQDIKNKSEDCLMTLDEHKKRLDEKGIKRFFQVSDSKTSKNTQVQVAKNNEESSKNNLINGSMSGAQTVKGSQEQSEKAILKNHINRTTQNLQKDCENLRAINVNKDPIKEVSLMSSQMSTQSSAQTGISTFNDEKRAALKAYKDQYVKLITECIDNKKELVSGKVLQVSEGKRKIRSPELENVCYLEKQVRTNSIARNSSKKKQVSLDSMMKPAF